VLPAEKLKNTKFVLLDQDEGSLKQAQLNIKTALNRSSKSAECEFLNLPIKKIVSGQNELKTQFDLVYSAGLFDYFEDDFASMAANELKKLLNNDGQLIIGNFDLSTPNQFGMALVFDWNLIYRTGEDLTRIFSRPGSRLRIESEEAQVNLFCIITNDK
jgi:SAM-dependent methyltransferase